MIQKTAIIDLGTNTFHLLISEGFKTLYEERRPVRLGVGGIHKNLITTEAATRAISCLSDYQMIVQNYGVKKLCAIGTSSLRNAMNASQVIQSIFEKTGIQVQVVSGELEASLIYDGIRSAVDFENGTSLIVDIGGGSVEFIIASQDELFWKQSVETGGQRLIELYQRHDPIHPNEVKDIRNHLDTQLSEVLMAIQQYRPTTLIGSSGSFDTISEIWCIQNGWNYSAGPETPLSIDGFHLIFNQILVSDRAKRMSIPGMIELRVDMIVVAGILIDSLIEKGRFDRLRVSGFSLKEGVRWRLQQGIPF